MLNRKGQTLVLFVILLPIMIGIMALVIDAGNAMYEKNHVDQVIEMSVEMFNSNKISFDEMKELLKNNLEGSSIEVVIDNDKINVKSSSYVSGIFSKLFGTQGFHIKSDYVSFVKNNETLG